MKLLKLVSIIIVLNFSIASSNGAYVRPTIGGGQTGGSMIDIGITYDTGAQKLIAEIPVSEVPTLRPLLSPDEFDPSKSWSILTGKAYNYQYSWNADEPITLPAGSAIWVELIDQTSGLEVYSPTYAPILSTKGTDVKWIWNGSMTHNRYAVNSPPLHSQYTATYSIYFGDSQTGSRQNYQQDGAGTATLTWNAIPEPVSLILLGVGWGLRRYRSLI